MNNTDGRIRASGEATFKLYPVYQNCPIFRAFERKEEVDRDDRSQSGNQAESALPAARLQFEMVSFSAVLFIFSLVTYTSPLYFVIMIYKKINHGKRRAPPKTVNIPLKYKQVQDVGR